MSVKWGEAVKPIPTAGMGEDSGTERDILTCATWPSSIAIHSHRLALTAHWSLHPQKKCVALNPCQGTKSPAGSFLQRGGGDKQCHPRFVLSSPTDFKS